jgi:putative transposase
MADQFPVRTLCNALEVSRSGYYAHRKKPLGRRYLQDDLLTPKIRETFERSKRRYGSPRIMMQLRREGERISKNRVARLMRKGGMRATTKGRWRPRTTKSDPKLAVAPNILAQIPRPAAPNQVWVSDITYLPTREGWHFLAVTMDLYSRRVVGWATAPTLETPLVTKALERAMLLRGRPAGLVHHSDRGCQYASRTYRETLSNAGITASMSRKGNCYDNAAMESFFATLKTEVFDRTIADTRRQAELMVFDYIETFYNPRRLHSSLSYHSPVEFETLHHQTPTNTPVQCPC